jgi:hypothetical protein
MCWLTNRWYPSGKVCLHSYHGYRRQCEHNSNGFCCNPEKDLPRRLIVESTDNEGIPPDPNASRCGCHKLVTGAQET